MILVGVTILLVAAMALNHAVHGVACWGLQPGGSLSATIYDLQILAALIGLLWLLVSVTRRTLPCSWPQLIAIAVLSIASVATYVQFGWAANTSIHWQGPENLLAFVTVAGTTYLIGRYGRRRRLQFSLRTLMVVFLLLGPLSAWFGPPIAEALHRWLYPAPEQPQQQPIFTKEELRKMMKEFDLRWQRGEPNEPPIKGGVI